MKLIVEEIDSKTKCIRQDRSIEVGSLLDLGTEFSSISVDDLRLMSFDLSPEQTTEIVSRFKIKLATKKSVLQLRALMSTDELSYKTHTRRELALMLRGSKPLAYFALYEGDRFEDICDQPFRKYVQSGRIVERRFRVGVAKEAVHYRAFTLPGEEWRAQSLRLLMQTCEKCCWSEGMERMQGALLGYTEEQTDEFIEKFFRPSEKDIKGQLS